MATRPAIASVIALSWLGLVESGSFAAQPLEQKVPLHISAQPLGPCLIEFGRQTRIQVLVASPDVNGLQCAGIDGEWSPQTALQELLKGTGLAYQLSGINSVAIFRPAPGNSTSRANGQGQGSTGAAHGASPDGLRSEEDRAKPAAAHQGQSPGLAPTQRFFAGETPSSSSERLEEITVTADRLAMDVMHSPISLTAMNGDEVLRDEVHHTVDLQLYVPGLSVTDAVLNTNLSIRGIGSGFTSPNIAQGVPIYRDGLLVPPNIGDEPLWDIETVQVLRGPQGTLVGANSTGGALFINSVNPNLGDRGGYAQVLAGSYHHLAFQAVSNIPFRDTLAARIGLLFEQRDSFSTNLTPVDAGLAPAPLPSSHRASPGDVGMLSLRTALLWRPTDWLQLEGRVTFFRNDTGYAAEKPISIASAGVDGTVSSCPSPGSYLNVAPTLWATVPSACGYAPFSPAKPYELAYAAQNTRLDERVWRESLEGRVRLGESGLSLRLLAGGAFNTVNLAAQASASNNLTAAYWNFVHERAITYEADLISSGKSLWNWVVGGFYWFDPAMIRYLGESYSGGPVGSGGGYAFPTGGLLAHANNTKLSYALFGNARYQISSQWTAEWGLRETWNHSSNPFMACSSCPGGDANAFYTGAPDPANPSGPLLFNGTGTANLGDEQDSFVTWRTALGFTPNPTMYYYASLATGAKSGGIQANTLGQNFAPEKDVDWELGFKSTDISDRLTLQVNGFYTRFTHMQIADNDTSTGQASIYNAGTTTLYGLELAGQAHLAQWQVNMAASYARSQFNIGNIVNKDICSLSTACSNSQGQCPPGGAGVNGCFDYLHGGLTLNGRFYPWLEDVSGLQLPNSPRLQFHIAVSYELRLPSGDVLSPRVVYSYQGSQYSQIFDTPFDVLPVRNNLNLTVEYDHAHWHAEAFMTNATNSVYPVAENDSNAQIFNHPREFGTRVTLRF